MGGVRVLGVWSNGCHILFHHIYAFCVSSYVYFELLLTPFNRHNFMKILLCFLLNDVLPKASVKVIFVNDFVVVGGDS